MPTRSESFLTLSEERTHTLKRWDEMLRYPVIGFIRKASSNFRVQKMKGLCFWFFILDSDFFQPVALPLYESSFSFFSASLRSRYSANTPSGSSLK